MDEKYNRIVKLRDDGKTWWEISQEIGDISMEMCRYRYKQAKGLLKPKNDGLSLRDYFAGKALQGMATWDKNTLELIERQMGIDDYWDYVADHAYLAADAMMEARKK